MLQKIDALDKSIVSSLNSCFKNYGYPIVDKIFAEYLIYLLPVILILLWLYSEKAKKVALKALFSVILAWPILANLLGHIINRSRPFEQVCIKELIFHRPSYSFPSDHASALFAVAFSFWFSGYKKLSLTVFAMAIIVSFFRVATAVHFPSDILGGLVVGLVAAYLIDLFDKPLSIIYNFILRIFRILKLA